MSQSSMTRSRIARHCVVLAAVAALAACTGENVSKEDMGATKTQPTEVTVAPAPAKPSFASVRDIYLTGDRDAALEAARELAAETDRETLDERLNAYWEFESDQRDEPLAVLWAEAIATSIDEAYTASYIAGLAYDKGISVEPDLAQVIEFWDRPEVYPIPTAQARLAEIYGDRDGLYYDADKASAARERARQ